jgi:hypothetical protein
MGGLGGTIQGLYGVIGPSLPKRKTILAMAAGFIIGLLWAYVISPTIFYDSDPSTLEQSFQDEWVKLLADRKAANPNRDVSDNIATLLLEVDDPVGVINRLIALPSEAENVAKLQAILPEAQRAQANAAAAPSPSFLGNLVPFIIGTLVIIVLFGIIAVVWNLVIYPLLEPQIRQFTKRGPVTAADAKMQAEIQAIKDSRDAAKTKAVDYTATLGKPIIQKFSTYIPGRGYDDSFSIEDENDRFLGECGASISESIGGAVTAMEVWLFDQNDFVRTMTGVLASPHAFTDPGIRAKLDEKGDVVQLAPGANLILETKTLRLQARVVELTLGTGADGLPNSTVERAMIEIAVWRKDAADVGAPPAPAAAPSYAPPPAVIQPIAPMQSSYAPPPQTPAPTQPIYAPPPAPPSYPPPGQIPPPPAPRRQEDDPFGGTGDFTPIT